MKRTLLTLLLTAAAATVQAAEPTPPKPAAELFPLADVKLLDPELLKIRELDHQYLLALDSDRILRNYRENFGIKTGLPELTGHESATGPHAGARGHYTGHYLSACAMMTASTGDGKLKAKADAMVAELAKIQQPNGYLSAQPESYFDELEANPHGHITWYCQHKLLAGLLDMAVYTGNAQALEVAKKFGDWVVARTGKISHDQMQLILRNEFGGMGEAMANLAAITGDARYLKAAKCFDHEEVLKPLAAGEDILTKHHGNTEIPKFIAAAREYELTGEESYRKAAEFFWQQVALHRSYVTGGNTIAERFHTPPDVLSSKIGPSTQETCNTYNMLKLTEHVFGLSPRADAGDFYERALYNHILATPHPETGMPLYYLGLSPGQWKMHFAPHQSFWCCAGSGLENFSKLQRGIYYHGKEELWVNLFIASELDWKEKGISLRQQTAFPNEPGTTLQVKAKEQTRLKINIRIPYWTKNAAIEVNGKPLKAELKPGSFATIDRTWKEGDTIKVSLPMSLHLEKMPDNPGMAAVMVGPLVLAGELGEVSMDKSQVQPTEQHCIDAFHKNQYPQAGQLALAGVTEKIEDWLEPVPGKPLTFKTKGVGQPQDFVLSPFYRLFDQRYNVYWRLESKADPAALKNWKDMRFGMFIHWGPVSLTGKEISWSRGSKNGTPVEVYDALYKQFNPEKFNADEWVSIAKAAGMKYIVLTAKHHDGFCLWDTKQTDYNIMHSPFKRDVVKELSEACKKQGIKFGCYYSVPDTHNPDYPFALTGGAQPKREKYDVDAYNKFLMAQTAELLRNYGPLVTVWYDTDGSVKKVYDKNRGQGVINMARGIQPDILINERTCAAGDYDTPEQRIGAFDLNRPWESCMTISKRNAWAWGGDSDGVKPLESCLRMIVFGAGGDGNVLLNVGPRPDGIIDPQQAGRLKEIGQWLSKYGESIYGTRGGPYKPYKRDLASTRKGSTVYLHIFRWTQDKITLPALPAKIVKSSVLTGGKAEVNQTDAGLEISVPAGDRQAIDTIIKLQLDKPALEIAPMELSRSGDIKATASNVHENNAEYAADKVVDGDPESRWATDAAAKSAWIILELPAERKITSANILQREDCANRVQAYEFQAEQNGEWKTLCSGEKLGADTLLKFEPVTAKKFRLNITKSTGGTTINEIELK